MRACLVLQNGTSDTFSFFLVDELGLVPGFEARFDVGQLGVSAWRRVHSIEPCPELDRGEGNFVTGCFATRNVDEITTITLEDGTELSGTSVHPVWSETDQNWKPLGELRTNEFVHGHDGELRVISVRTKIERQTVYNLEVDKDHVYRVTALGIIVLNG